MILTLFARLTCVSELPWIVRLYYYGLFVNKGIGLILLIQTFCPAAPSVLYNKDVALLLYDPLRFILIYLNHIRLYKTPSYRSHTLLILRLIDIYVHYYVFIYYYYYHVLGPLYIYLY